MLSYFRLAIAIVITLVISTLLHYIVIAITVILQLIAIASAAIDSHCYCRYQHIEFVSHTLAERPCIICSHCLLLHYIAVFVCHWLLAMDWLTLLLLLNRPINTDDIEPVELSRQRLSLAIAMVS
jgi:hypothetical protein